jgi:hypothetical protein
LLIPSIVKTGLSIICKRLPTFLNLSGVSLIVYKRGPPILFGDGVSCTNENLVLYSGLLDVTVLAYKICPSCTLVFDAV